MILNAVICIWALGPPLPIRVEVLGYISATTAVLVLHTHYGTSTKARGNVFCTVSCNICAYDMYVKHGDNSGKAAGK